MHTNPADFTLFHITLHLILWCVTYGPPCILILAWSLLIRWLSCISIFSMLLGLHTKVIV